MNLLRSIVFLALAAINLAGGAGRALAADPALADLTEQVVALFGKGDYTTLARLANEWQGAGGVMPFCRDGQTRLCVITSAFDERVRKPRDGYQVKEVMALLAAWQRAQPDAGWWRLYQAYVTGREIITMELEENSVDKWKAGFVLLNEAGTKLGRTGDWYCAYARIAEAAHRLVSKHRLNELPAEVQNWNAVFDEGVRAWPQHCEIWWQTGEAARALGYPNNYTGWSGHLCDLLPTQHNAPYARFWWKMEGGYPTGLFKSPPPRGADWPKMREGFRTLMQQWPQSKRVVAKFLELARRAEDRETALQLLGVLGDHPGEEAFPIDALFLEIKQWAIGQSLEKQPIWSKRIVSKYTDDKDMLSVAWSTDGKQVYGGFVSPDIGVFDAQSGEIVKRLRLVDDGLMRRTYDIRTSPDGRYLAALKGSSAGKHSGYCRVWRTSDDSIVGGFATDTGAWRVIAWGPDSAQLMAAGGTLNVDGAAYLWTDDNKTNELTWASQDKHSIRAAAWAPDNSKVIFNSDSGKMLVAEPGNHLATIKQIVVPRLTWVNELNFSPDGQWFAAACGYSRTGPLKATGAIAIFRTSDLAPRNDALPPLTRALKTLDWSPDGKLIACAGDDGFLYLLDPVSLNIVRWWNLKQGTINKVRWSPDGSRLATCSSTGLFSVWDAR